MPYKGPDVAITSHGSCHGLLVICEASRVTVNSNYITPLVFFVVECTRSGWIVPEYTSAIFIA